MKKILCFLVFLLPFLLNAQPKDVEHVILIGVDGLGANYLKKAEHIPHIKQMIQEGSHTMEARCVRPSSSAVNWAAMTMGANPSLTGYTEWDSKEPEIPSRAQGKYEMFPSIFELMHDQKPDAEIGAIYTWSGIGHLFPKEAVHKDEHTDSDSLTLEKAIDYIQTDNPNLLFLHFDEVDGAGHGIGWGTDEYYEAIKKIDERVGALINAVEEQGAIDKTVFILTSDHGGFEQGHGGIHIEEMEIPWIAYGKNVKENNKLDLSVMTFDTASTIAYLFGLEQPQVWTGRPIKDAFQQ